jgi:hypothetical protein
MGGKHAAGKGDQYRPVDWKLWDKNWEEIFGNGKAKKQKPKRKRNSKTHPPAGNA